MPKKAGTIQRDRSAVDGQFKPTGWAKQHKKTGFVDTMPAPVKDKKK